MTATDRERTWWYAYGFARGRGYPGEVCAEFARYVTKPELAVNPDSKWDEFIRSRRAAANVRAGE